jgi:hypothetical protein
MPDGAHQEATPEAEAKLVAALQRGEADAYEQLVRANTGRIQASARCSKNT